MTILQLKEGVVITGNVYTNAILHAVQTVYARHDVMSLITSGNDSTHGPHSYHGNDRALDIRFWDIPPENRRAVAEEIRAILPPFYDVVIETDHYHLEADEVKERAGLPASKG